MGLIHEAAKKAGKALGGVRAGPEKIAIRRLGADGLATLAVTSPAFSPGYPLPVSATIDGEGVPPPVRWRNVPASARSIAIVVEDPDAPMPEPFVHWLVYGIPVSVGSVEGRPAPSRDVGREGQNSTTKRGFAPAAPPPGHGTHHYHFQVFALDVDLDLDAGAGRSDLFDAMRGHVVACGDIVGTYERR